MPYKRKRNNKIEWYGKIMVEGQAVSKKMPTKKDAQNWEKEQKTLLKARKRTGTISLLSIIEQYLDSVESRLSKSSYYSKRLVFKRLLKSIKPETLIADISYTDIEKYMFEIKEERTVHTANVHLIHIIAMYNWGIKALKLPKPNPWSVDKLKETKNDKYVPSIDDFYKIYEVAEGSDKIMLLALFHLAARRNEILKMRWEDVDFPNNKVRLWTGKRQGGREFNWLPLSSDLYKALQEQYKITGQMEFVFINPKTSKPYGQRNKFVKRLCKKADVKCFNYHAIRHLSASLMDNSKVPLASIQLMLRHKMASTTSTYLHSLGSINVMVDEVFGKQ